MISKIIKRLKKSSELIRSNQEAIDNYNAKILSRSALFIGLILIIPITINITTARFYHLIPPFLLVMAISLLMFFLFLHQKMKKYAIVGAYIIMTLCYLLVMHISLDSFPERSATAILIFFTITHLLIVDKPYRIMLVIFIYYLIHLFLAFVIKGNDLGIIDMINSTIAYFLGALFGGVVLNERLVGFETERLLIIEKETDVLTGLSNRRSLFDQLEKFDKNLAKKPTAIMMIDIDNFKHYNDTYGHHCGDDVLRYYGRLLNDIARRYHLEVYRYGGEEFIVLLWDNEKTNVEKIAESIRNSSAKLVVSNVEVTVSIGLVFCDDAVANYDRYLSRADQALYVAKSLNRNKVMVWDENFTLPTSK